MHVLRLMSQRPLIPSPLLPFTAAQATCGGLLYPRNKVRCYHSLPWEGGPINQSIFPVPDSLWYINLCSLRVATFHHGDERGEGQRAWLLLITYSWLTLSFEAPGKKSIFFSPWGGSSEASMRDFKVTSSHAASCIAFGALVEESCIL